MKQTETFKRLNITLSPDTWSRLQKESSRMKRSQFIDHALKVYLTHLKRRNLKRELKEEALANAEEDQKNLNEWFSLDQEAWDSIK